MNIQTTITFTEVCQYFQIDLETVQDFAEFGLYPTLTDNGETGIESCYLEKLKRIISLHKSLGINKEGIEVILGLLEKNAELQKEMDTLKNQLERLKTESHGLLIEIDVQEL